MTKGGVRYFEYHDGSSQKFWELTLEGSRYSVRFGRIGAAGQTRTKRFDSHAAAKEAANALMLQKHRRGYVYIEAPDDAAPAAAEPLDDGSDFWGPIERGWSGFASQRGFQIPRFSVHLCVGLGPEDDGYIELAEPTAAELAAYRLDFERFLEAIDAHYERISKETFASYEATLASYYENEKRSGKPPLGLNADTHMKYLQLCRLRVQTPSALRLICDYALDPEHGLEVVLKDNTFWRLGGISDVLR